jgi:hypothetical protein
VNSLIELVRSKLGQVARSFPMVCAIVEGMVSDREVGGELEAQGSSHLSRRDAYISIYHSF